jgi:hypothetical protein
VDERGGGFGHAHIAFVGSDGLDAATEPRALTGAAVRL